MTHNDEFGERFAEIVRREERIAHPEPQATVWEWMALGAICIASWVVLLAGIVWAVRR